LQQQTEHLPVNLCVPASQTALFQVRGSLIPDRTGSRQPFASLTPPARLPDRACALRLPAGDTKDLAVAGAAIFPDLIT